MSTMTSPAGDWKAVLAERLPLYGHRNWICVVDAAYPAQTGEGIEVILCDEPQIEVIKGVLEMLTAAKHVRPAIYLDKELAMVKERDAAGIDGYRKELDELLVKQKTISLLHEKIIGKLEEAGRTFRVLMLKTDLTLPYTSVFIQLDCGYWSDEAEKRLRKSMGK